MLQLTIEAVAEKIHSDFIVYVDESGHASADVDPNFPCFVLAFCLFPKESYRRNLTPRMQQLKFRYFGHDMVVLHEREIRKEMNHFVVLRDKQKKEEFMTDLSNLVQQAEFEVISKVIRKDREKDPSGHLYHVATQFCLEALYEKLKELRQHEVTTHIVFEERGNKEDKQLELEFRRVCDGENWHRLNYPFEIIFASKKSNSTGLQFADLVARPIGLADLRPEQRNRAYEIIRSKKLMPSFVQKELDLP